MEGGGGGDTASYDDELAIEDADDGGVATPPPPSPPQQPPAMAVAVVLAISRRRPGAPHVPRPRRRRAAVPGAVGSGHSARRRTKEFLQWREWYLREKRREREAARWYHIGIPPV